MSAPNPTASGCRPTAIPACRRSNSRSFPRNPFYDDLEELLLTESLDRIRGRDGHGIVRTSAWRSPGKVPVIAPTNSSPGPSSRDLALRKKLYAGGAAALKDVADPMLDLARVMDPFGRSFRKQFDELDESQKQAYAQIAKARFALEGASDYPDATFTLRLSYGTIESYQETGKTVPAFTDIAGLYRRSAEHNNESPFDLPKRWIERKDRLKMDTPFNFVSTADIIGGNSGSPCGQPRRGVWWASFLTAISSRYRSTTPTPIKRRGRFQWIRGRSCMRCSRSTKPMRW